MSGRAKGEQRGGSLRAPSSPSLTDAIDAALLAVDRALANEMQTIDRESAGPHLTRLREALQGMRARRAVTDDELRGMIRAVATWAPPDDVSLLSALGLIARTRDN